MGVINSRLIREAYKVRKSGEYGGKLRVMAPETAAEREGFTLEFCGARGKLRVLLRGSRERCERRYGDLLRKQRANARSAGEEE